MKSYLSAKYSFISLLILVILTYVSYSNSFNGEFHFDDQIFLVKFSSVKDASGFDGLIRLLRTFGDFARPVVNVTFALNYMYGGLDARSFHITSFVIHVLNGFLLYYFVLLTIRMSESSAHVKERAPTVAMITTALFLLHPVQTQAVSYISQRYETMASFFYLASMISYIVSVRSNRSGWFLFFSVLSLSFYLLGLGSKEIVATVPITMIVFSYCFLRDRRLVKRLALPVMMTVLSFGAAVFLIGRVKGPASVGFGVGGVTPWEYFLTQARAIVLYLRLLVFPVNQNLDYAFEPSRNLFEIDTALAVLIIISLIAGAVIGIRKWKLASFSVLWFFILLSPTSSFLPIVDPVFEHRVYLASAGLFLNAAYGFSRGFSSPVSWKRAFSYASLAVILILFASATYERNRVWASNVSLWEDVARKSPDKARVHYNLANAYREKRMLEKAIEQYKVSIRLDPKKSNAYNNLANSYIVLGRYKEAIGVYKKAIIADEKNYEAHYNLGVALRQMGRHEEAKTYLKEFVRKAPGRLRLQKDVARKYIKELGG